VHLLRNAGDEVTITVQYLREAPSFLKLPLGKRKLMDRSKLFSSLQYSYNKMTMTEIGIQSFSVLQEEIENYVCTLMLNV